MDSSINKIVRNTPASLAASAAEAHAFSEQRRRKGNAPERSGRPGPSRNKSPERPCTNRNKSPVRQQRTRKPSRWGPPPSSEQAASQQEPQGPKRAPKSGRWGSALHFPLPKRGQPGGLDDPLRKGMSGAAVRRYLILLHEGKSAEEARALSLSSAGGKAGGKRGSESITPPQRPHPKKQRTELRPSSAVKSTSFADAAKCTKVAVAAANHPLETLSQEDLSLVEEALIKLLISATSPSGESIAFGGITFRPGMLLLRCENQRTIDWVRSTIPKIPDWKGLALKAYVGDEIPRDHSIKVYLPRSGDLDDTSILKLLAVQNVELNISSWRVMKSIKEKDGILMHIGIDDQSCAEIVRRNHLLHYRFGSIPVSGLKKMAEMETAAATVPAEEETASVCSLDGKMAGLDVVSGGQVEQMETLTEEEMLLASDDDEQRPTPTDETVTGTPAPESGDAKGLPSQSNPVL